MKIKEELTHKDKWCPFVSFVFASASGLFGGCCGFASNLNLMGSILGWWLAGLNG